MKAKQNLIDGYVGKTFWGGMFNPKTVGPGGHKKRVLISAIQKLLRQHRRGDAVKVLLNLLKLSKVSKLPNIESNTINRIADVIPVEDMSPFEVNSFLEIRKCRNDLENGDRKDSRYLIRIIDIICASKMSRICSDIRTYFHKALVHNLGCKVDTEWESTKTLPKSVVKKDDSETLLKLTHNFWDLFMEKDYNCFYWLYKIYNDSSKCGRRYNRRQGSYIIFDLLKYHISEDDPMIKKKLKYLDEMIGLYHKKTRKERHLFLLAPVIVWMTGENDIWNDFKSSNINLISKDEFVVIQYSHFIDNDSKVNIPDEANDIHTGKKGATKLEFAKFGALVNNEDGRFKKWKNMWNPCYLKVKELEDEQKKSRKRKR